MLILSSRAIKFGFSARWSAEIASWKVGPLLRLTNSHTIGGEGISPIIIYNTRWYKYTAESIISKLLVVDDKLNHIGWVEPQIINPEI